MQWVSEPQRRKMDEVMSERAVILREQMQSAAERTTKEEKENSENND